ncbi:hypothetical protein GF366_00415 [Candidatus Peregrinibacteria bacterium]|nr:hypothetical protein [Candidatus Peregrinibacteria bacterium]
MKAKCLKLLFPFLTVLVLAGTAVAATGTIDAVDSEGVVQSEFGSSENVYVKGYCTPAESDSFVDVYVVDDQSLWNNGDPLNDVTGIVETVAVDATGFVPLTMIWANPLISGDYDVVLDINQNGVWDTFEICVDNFEPVGFNVPQPVGSAMVSKGSKDPGDHNWILGEGDPNNVMLQFVVSVDSTEDVDVNSFTLEASGTGEDSLAFSNILIVEDSDNDGVYNDGIDNIWGTGNYADDDGALDISVDETVSAGTSKTLMVVYIMGTSMNEGDTFNFSLTGIDAVGVDSSSSVDITNLPLDSGEKTILLPSEICSGSLDLSFLPGTALPEEQISAVVTGLSGCSGEEVDLREGPCTGAVLDTCVVGTSGCVLSFNAPTDVGTYEYYACVDMNGDADFDDEGEMDSAVLTVAEEEEEEIADPFEDIEGHWAEEFIDDLRLKGIVSGKETGIFSPDALITRAELTKIALEAFGFEIPESVGEKPFSDVELTDWYAPYIQKAKETGAVDGYEDGTFKPNQVINRVEALKILLEAANADIGSSEEATFPDTAADAWYSEYINYGIATGVISGYSIGEYEGMFRPAFTITRAEVAKIVSMLLAL